MRTIDSTLVDIARDFLDAHQALRRLAARHRSGELHFDEVVSLVGDDEESVLFRLKERCHSVFRIEEEANVAIGPGVLFDLAVGSLFHEAMKFRENVYTRDVYGPRVRALRQADVPDAAGLLRESEKIIADSGARLEESLLEAETLLRQTVGQFRVLLRESQANAYVTRFMMEHRVQVEEVLGDPLEVVLAATHGHAAQGFAAAARSYLKSGFFEAGGRAVAEAQRHGFEDAQSRGLTAYAEGMQAYLDGGYAHSLRRLRDWTDAPRDPGTADLAGLAVTALSRLGQLVDAETAPGLADEATELAQRIRERADGAATI